MTTQYILVFLITYGAAMTNGSPVYAEKSIIPLLPIEDRCAFICNICFDDNVPLIMKCVNTMCPLMEERFVFVNLWISQRCDNYQDLADTFFPNGIPVRKVAQEKIPGNE